MLEKNLNEPATHPEGEEREEILVMRGRPDPRRDPRKNSNPDRAGALPLWFSCGFAAHSEGMGDFLRPPPGGELEEVFPYNSE
jgi:hypothetical protein